ncbi:MAG: PDDEXK nuclease domain-containing protein [Desulfuromonadaceae bacterium]|nr:PDDEXK nuclease domain-containing protein [Desulfuromonadaceae bacterium]
MVTKKNKVSIQINRPFKAGHPDAKSFINVSGNGLMDRVVSILEQARANAVRAINSNMVIAYWLIGREIVQELQRGEERAEYGKQVVDTLSRQLTQRYGSGFSITSLKYFRTFYLTYQNRLVEIGHPLGDQLDNPPISRPLGDQSARISFSSQLSWSHYRALMRVVKPEARDFYEQETIECCWDKRSLERQIHSQFYERMLKSQTPQQMVERARQEIMPRPEGIDSLKNPYVLEFLGLPEVSTLHEKQLEAAIITHLQTFLLELGKGFAFVARQKRMRFDDTDLYIDLVFYNCILKCYLLIDLKMGELSHRDVGQMEGYVRMFEDLYTAPDDNPTIGLILCDKKNEAVAKYSVLNDRKQIFASKYMLYLPTEEELQIELARERKLIEARELDFEAEEDNQL